MEKKLSLKNTIYTKKKSGSLNIFFLIILLRRYILSGYNPSWLVDVELSYWSVICPKVACFGVELPYWSLRM